VNENGRLTWVDASSPLSGRTVFASIQLNVSIWQK
jgi:hypothetical protein